MAQNRFARQLAELDQDERQLAGAAIAAARRAFAGFEEREGSEAGLVAETIKGSNRS